MDSVSKGITCIACPICFEASVPKAQFRAVQTHSWVNSDRCDAHGICQPCMQRYVELKILDEGVWHIRCPGEGCRYRLVVDNVRDALSSVPREEEALARYEQLRNEDCASRLRGAINDALEDESQAWLLQDCQACPRCFVLTFRADGCLHLACRCGAHFCYGCGAPNADGDACMCDMRDMGMETDVRSSRFALWLAAGTSPVVEDLRPALSRVWDLDPQQARRLQQAELERLERERQMRWDLAWDEASAEWWRLQQPPTLAAYLGVEIQAVMDPEDRYAHRMEVRFWDGVEWDDVWWSDDVEEDENFALQCELDDFPNPALSARARPQKEHGAPLQFRTVKAWMPSAECAKPQRRRVTIPTQPHRQRNALGAARPVREAATEVRTLRRKAQQLQTMRRAEERDVAAFNEERQQSL